MDLLTYARMTELFWASKSRQKLEKGVKFKGDSRIFRNANNSFTLRHVYSKARKYEELLDPVDIFTVRPDDSVTIHNGTGRSYRYYGYGDYLIHERVRNFCPAIRRESGYARNLYAINPDAGPEPEANSVPVVPRFVGFVPREDSQRAQWEANIAKFGSIDAWYDAERDADAIDRDNQKRRNDWWSKRHVSLFDGMVVNKDGVVSRRSLGKFEQHQRAIERKRQAEDRKRRKVWDAENRKLERERARAQKKMREELGLGPELDARLVQFIHENKLTITEEDGNKVLLLHKAVGEDYKSRHGGLYEIGTIVKAEDWDGGKPRCGYGLHFSATFEQAYSYHQLGGSDRKARNLVCAVPLDETVVIDYQKVKAPWCKVIEEVPTS